MLFDGSPPDRHSEEVLMLLGHKARLCLASGLSDGRPSAICTPPALALQPAPHRLLKNTLNWAAMATAAKAKPGHSQMVSHVSQMLSVTVSPRGGVDGLSRHLKKQRRSTRPGCLSAARPLQRVNHRPPIGGQCHAITAYARGV